MPARRDYGDAWRDTWVTLAQIPAASLVATDYFYQQWLERSSSYLSQVSARLVLARPIAAAEDTGENVMADVLSEDIVDATRSLVRNLVSLPGEAAQYFSRHLADALREVLARIQPDAQTDTRTYVINQLETLNAELYRLREVAGAELRLRDRDSSRAAPDKDPDEASLSSLLEAIRATTEGAQKARRGAPQSERESTPQERMLQIIQAIVAEALKHFAPKTPGEAPDTEQRRGAGEQAARLLLAFQDAGIEIERAKRNLEDEGESAAKPRARREVARTRGYPRRRATNPAER